MRTPENLAKLEELTNAALEEHRKLLEADRVQQKCLADMQHAQFALDRAQDECREQEILWNKASLNLRDFLKKGDEE